MSIPKYILNGSETTPYTQSTTCGGSIPATSTPAAVATVVTNHYLAANHSTVHWGYYSKAQPPSMYVNSGETITVEMITHHAGAPRGVQPSRAAPRASALAAATRPSLRMPPR